MGLFFMHDDPFFDKNIILSHFDRQNYLTVLDQIELRLILFLRYIDYMSDKKIKAYKYNNKLVIGTFEQWLCYNRYGSLVIEE